MTKLIAALIIVLACWGVWELFLYWEKVKNTEEAKQKQDANALVIGDNLPGLQGNLEPSLRDAKSKGAGALRAWLKAHGQSVEDPRKAWIELDFCVAVAREDPTEARRVFASVKERISSASPVYPRLKQLAPAYE
jgi:hypothetical protein